MTLVLPDLYLPLNSATEILWLAGEKRKEEEKYWTDEPGKKNKNKGLTEQACAMHCGGLMPGEKIWPPFT